MDPGRGTPAHGFSAAANMAAARPSYGTAPFDRLAASPLTRSSLGTEPVVARDQHLASIFRNLRGLLGVTEASLARALGTDVSVVLDLEAGAIDELPPWPELVRIVERYSGIAKVDTSPILTRLIAVVPQRSVTTTRPVTGPALLRPMAPAVAPPAAPPATAMQLPMPQSASYATGTALMPVPAPRATPQATRAPETDTAAADAQAEAARVRRRRRTRRTLSIVLPLLTVLVPIIAIVAAPQPVYVAANALPSIVKTPLRQLVDAIVLQAAPVRDGLRWVDTGDPRLRKADLRPNR